MSGRAGSQSSPALRGCDATGHAFGPPAATAIQPQRLWEFWGIGVQTATLSPTCRPRRLNILEAAVKEERWRYCRIDGSVSSAAGWSRQNALMGGADAHTLQWTWHVMPMVMQMHGSAHHIFVAMLAHCYALPAEREARVRQFQTSSSIPLFLLTSQVGRSCGSFAVLHQQCCRRASSWYLQQECCAL